MRRARTVSRRLDRRPLWRGPNEPLAALVLGWHLCGLGAERLLINGPLRKIVEVGCNSVKGSAVRSCMQSLSVLFDLDALMTTLGWRGALALLVGAALLLAVWSVT